MQQAIEGQCNGCQDPKPNLQFLAYVHTLTSKMLCGFLVAKGMLLFGISN